MKWRECFYRQPHRYHTGSGCSFGVQHADLIFSTLGLGAGDCFLDAGCGPGEYSILAAELHQTDRSRRHRRLSREHLFSGQAACNQATDRGHVENRHGIKTHDPAPLIIIDNGLKQRIPDGQLYEIQGCLSNR